MCNCINEVENSLKDKYGPTLSLARANFGFRLKDGYLVFVTPLPVQYVSGRKNGKPGRVVSCHELLYANYCPFCGAKLYSPHDAIHEKQTS